MVTLQVNGADVDVDEHCGALPSTAIAIESVAGDTNAGLRAFADAAVALGMVTVKVTPAVLTPATADAAPFVAGSAEEPPSNIERTFAIRSLRSD